MRKGEGRFGGRGRGGVDDGREEELQEDGTWVTPHPTLEGVCGLTLLIPAHTFKKLLMNHSRN